MSTRTETINQETEELLRKRGIEFTVQTLPVTDYSEKESRANQARPEWRDEDVVNDFAQAMRGGAKFPRPVWRPVGGGRFAGLGGNHTVAAHKRVGHHTVEVYVTEDIPTELAHLVVVEHNNKNGARVPTDWRCHQAMLLLTDGYSEQQVAEFTALSPARVGQAHRALRASARAEKLGIDHFETLILDVQAAIGGVQLDTAFLALAEVAVSAREPEKKAPAFPKLRERVVEIVRRVKDAPSENEALDLIEAFRVEVEQARSRPRLKRTQASAKLNLVSSCGKICEIQPGAISAVAHGPNERDIIRDWVKRTTERLAEIMDELDGK